MTTSEADEILKTAMEDMKVDPQDGHGDLRRAPRRSGGAATVPGYAPVSAGTPNRARSTRSNAALSEWPVMRATMRPRTGRPSR